MAYAGAHSFQMIQTTDAQFRAWGSIVSAKMALMGLVKTSDTGQIDWATVLTPSAAAQSRGYEIWRFADALQATDPVFIKLEYGSANGAATAPCLYLTVGNATNGAGTLTGTLSTRYAVGLSSAHTAPWLSMFSGDVDRFVMALGVGSQSTNPAMLLSVERKVDAAGVRIAGGTLITVSTTQFGMGSTGRQEYFEHGIAPFVEASIGIFLPKVSAPTIVGSGADGNYVTLFPQYHARGGFLPYGLNLMGYMFGAVGPLSLFTVEMYGASHTYFALGEVTGSNWNRTGETLGRLAIRYE